MSFVYIRYTANGHFHLGNDLARIFQHILGKVLGKGSAKGLQKFWQGVR